MQDTEKNAMCNTSPNLEIDINDSAIQAGLVLKVLSNGMNGNFTLSAREIADEIQKVFPTIKIDIVQKTLEKLHKTSCLGMLSRDGEPIKWNLALRFGYTSF